MDLTVYYNGELLNSSEVPLSIYDNGFLYGDGVKIDLKVYDRRIFLFKPTLEKFYYSLDKLKIPFSTTEKTIEKTIKTLLDLNCLNDAVVSIIVTRGEGLHNFNSNIKLFPNILITVNPPPQISDIYSYQGISLITSELRLFPKVSFDHQIFSISAQHNILGIYEAKNKGVFDSIFINLEGQICQTSRANIFFVKNGQILTPDLECGVKNFPMRQLIMKIAQNLNLQLFEAFLPLSRINEMDECFIASIEAEILPAIKIDGNNIGEGRPGKITSLINKSFRAITKKDFFEDDIS